MKGNNYQEKKRRYVVLCVSIFLFCTGIYYTTNCKKNPFIMGEKRKIEDLLIETEEVEEKISVTVLGAVKNGGTFSMKKGDTIEDILHLAGGLTEQADPSKISLADAVFHEESIYIPVVGEKVKTCIGYRQQTFQKNGGKRMKEWNETININEADEKTLCSLPFIGEKKARAIIEYRQSNGQFISIEQIKEVDGIGKKTFEEIKSYLTIE